MFNTEIQLISAGDIDNNYNHTPYFLNRLDQNNYFRQRTLFQIDESNYSRKDGNYYVNKTLKQLETVNYMIARNANQTYFYFINDKIYKNEGMTELALQLDVVQTYIHDLYFSDCLIEREQVDRWDTFGNAIPHFLNENLETGEYLLKSTSTIYDYKNKGTYFITSSDRLGTSNDGRPGNPSQPSRGRRSKL